MTPFAERYAAPLRVLAWTGGAVSILLYGLTFASAYLAHVPDWTFDITWVFAFAVMASVGAVIAARRPDNAVGWLFIGAGLLMLANGFGNAYADFAGATHHLPIAMRLAGWFRFWSWMPAICLVAVLLAVFPTGRPVSSLWRWFVRLALFVGTLSFFAALGVYGAPIAKLSASNSSSPGELPGGGPLQLLSGPVPALLLLGSIAIVHRFVRSRGIERLQMKWFTFGTAILATGVLIFYSISGNDPISNPLAYAPITLGFMALPVTSAIAILRYRLYDIDRLISRTVSYALVTAVLLGTFAVLAILPGFVLFSGRHTPDWLVAGATLLVVALARPVLRSVRAFVDKRFDRSRYDAAATIATFGSRLRDDIDMQSLVAEIETTVRRTMNPAYVSLWLR